MGSGNNDTVEAIEPGARAARVRSAIRTQTDALDALKACSVDT